MASKHPRLIAADILWTLLNYYLSRDATGIKINMDTDEDSFFIDLSGNITIEATDVDKLRNVLSGPYSGMMEHYYSELLHGAYRDSNLMMVGSLIERATVVYKDGLLSIKAQSKRHPGQ